MSPTRPSEARSLLRRILEDQRIRDLHDEERALLEKLSGPPTPISDEEVRPLWWWIREGFYRAPAPLREYFTSIDSEELDRLLDACGAPRGTSWVLGRLLTPITLTALKRGTANLLRNEDSGFRHHLPAVVAGFGGFRELTPVIAAMASSDEVSYSISRWKFLGALQLLEFEGLASLAASSSDEWVRLGVLEARASSLSLPEVLDGLGEEGWTSVRASAYPRLVDAFAKLGGDLLDLVKKDHFCLFAFENPPHAVPVARALILRADPLALGIALENLAEDGWGCLAQFYVEIAAARCLWALPILEARLEVLMAPDEESAAFPPPMGLSPELMILTWAIAALRADGPRWCEEVAASSPELEALRAAKALLAITRRDAAPLLHPLLTDEEESVREVAWIARAEALGGSVLALERAEESGLDLGWASYLLLRISEMSGTRNPFMEVAFHVMHPSERWQRPQELSEADVDRLIALCRIPHEIPKGHRNGLLQLARGLPPEQAAPLLEALLLRILDDPSLTLLELGCVDAWEERVSGFTAALLRLFAGDTNRPSSLAEPDRSLALTFLVNSELPTECHLAVMRALQGDPAMDSLLGFLTYAGRYNSGFPLLRIGGSGDLLPTAFAVMGSGDRLSGILSHPDAALAPDRIVGVRLLLASVSPDVRAVAISLLFTPESVRPETRHLRSLLLNDSSPEVRSAILALVGVVPFEEEELDALLGEVAPTRDQDIHGATAVAIGRLGRADYCGRLLALLRHPNDQVVKEARKAFRRVLSRGDAEVVFLSIADAHEITAEYDQAAPGLRVQISALFHDERSEAMRLLLAALTQRSDARLASEVQGRRLIVAPVTEWPPPPAPGTLLSQEEFEKLALHLHVLFVDAATGSIVAEVGTEPSGEILNAIFETGDTAVLQVVWG